MLQNENNKQLTVINDKHALAQENPLAFKILDLREKIDEITVELKQAEQEFLDKMANAGIKSINTTFGSFIRSERENVKVDKEAATTFLDSMGILAEFSKLDDTKVKKIYPTAEFIKTGEPTVYLTIRK